MEIDSFIVSLKTEYVYRNIANDVKEKELILQIMTVKTLPTGKNKKLIRLIVIRRGFRAKTYSYLTFITMTMKKLRSRGNNKKRPAFEDY